MMREAIPNTSCLFLFNLFIYIEKGNTSSSMLSGRINERREINVNKELRPARGSCSSAHSDLLMINIKLLCALLVITIRPNLSMFHLADGLATGQ